MPSNNTRTTLMNMEKNCSIPHVQFFLIYAVQTEAPSEEKRQQHQKELAQKLNEEARERIRGTKSGGEDKK